MPDYSKGKIYKIVCNETGLVYIGSTTNTLNKRLNQHKSHEKYIQKCVSREIIQNNNYKIELIEEVNASTKLELLQRERYWIENSECINIALPLRTPKEYYETNKEKIKEYLEKNKEKIRQLKKEWHEKKKLQMTSSSDLTTISSNP